MSIRYLFLLDSRKRPGAASIIIQRVLFLCASRLIRTCIKVCCSLSNRMEIVSDRYIWHGGKKKKKEVKLLSYSLLVLYEMHVYILYEVHRIIVGRKEGKLYTHCSLCFRSTLLFIPNNREQSVLLQDSKFCIRLIFQCIA